jgi:hypothetical protein
MLYLRIPVSDTLRARKSSNSSPSAAAKLDILWKRSVDGAVAQPLDATGRPREA